MKLLITIEVDTQNLVTGLKNLKDEEYTIVDIKMKPAASEPSYDVILRSCGEKKIAVIKEIRAITKLGLIEAKDIADNLSVITTTPWKVEAERIKQQLEEIGFGVKVAIVEKEKG